MNRAALIALAGRWEVEAAQRYRVEDSPDRGDVMVDCARELRALVEQSNCLPHDWVAGEWMFCGRVITHGARGSSRTNTCAKCGATSTEER